MNRSWPSVSSTRFRTSRGAIPSGAVAISTARVRAAFVKWACSLVSCSTATCSAWSMVSTTRLGVNACRGRPKIRSTACASNPCCLAVSRHSSFTSASGHSSLALLSLKRHVRLGGPAAHAARPDLRFNLVRPARPVLRQRLGHTGHTERKLLVRFERDAKFVRQRRAEIGPDDFLRLEQRSRVDGTRRPVLPPGRVQDKAMGVELRILAPRLPVREYRDQQISVLPLVTTAPTPRRAEFSAHVAERLVDRPIERRRDQAALLVVAYRPKRRHVLRHAQAKVYGRPTVGLARVLGEGLARLRMVAIKELLKVFLQGDTGNAKRTRRGVLVPDAGTLVAARVVIGRGKLGVVPPTLAPDLLIRSR